MVVCSETPYQWREVLDWLLSSKLPTVRFRALLELVGREEWDRDVRRARQDIMDSGPVQKILERQLPGGHWGDPLRPYSDKYRGSVWTLILLAELRADPQDERVRAAGEHILQTSQHRQSGGFTCRGLANEKQGKAGVIPCLTANMLYSLIKLGFEGDERLRKTVDWIATNQRFGCDPPPKEWPYLYDRCWRPHDCRSGAVKAMRALACLPDPLRTVASERALRNGREFLLEQCLVGNGAGLKMTARPDWFRLGHPRMWDTDILEIVRVLQLSGAKDHRMVEAIEFIRSKANSRGRWAQESRFIDRMLVRPERKGTESALVTLEASVALQGYGLKHHSWRLKQCSHEHYDDK